MICKPDGRGSGRWRLLAALGGAALACAVPGSAQPLREAAQLVAMARDDLARGDGIAAEVRLKQALEKGAAREAVAAYMGEALIAQDQLHRAHDWLSPGMFTRQTAALGFRTLARLEQMRGDLPAAGTAYDRVIALTPEDPTLWVEIARLRYRGGEHMLALDAANYAYELDSSDIRVLELRGQIVRDRYGFVAALAWFEAALARDADDLSVLGEYAATLGDLGRAKDMLAATRRMLELDPANARAYYLQAVLAARAGNPELARRLLAKAGDELNGIPAVLLLEGVLELETGNYVLAAEALEKLVRRQPDNEKALLVLLRALFMAGEYRQIVLRFAEAGADADAPPYLLTVLARSYEALGEREQAAPLLDRAARFRAGPDRIARLSTLESEAVAEETRAAHAGNFDAQARAGDVQLALGRPEAALERYRMAARIRLPEALALRMVAAHRLVGDEAAARALSENFLAGHPRSEIGARLVAQTAAAAGDWPRARLLLENLIANGAQRDVRALTDLAVARLRAGAPAEAEQSARDAYRLQRSNPSAAEAWGLGLAVLGQDPHTAAALLAKARLLLGDTPLIDEGRMRLKPL